MSKAFEYGDQQPPGGPEAALSALLDGEVSEFEVRRLLYQVAENPDLADTWARYSLSRSIREGEPFRRAPRGFSRRVMEAVADEKCDDRREGVNPAFSSIREQKVTSGRRWPHLMGRLAVAASVAVAVFLGMEVALERDATQPALVADGSQEAATARSQERDIEIDADAQQRLNEYIQSVAISGNDSRDSVNNAFAELENLRRTPQLRPVADRELVSPERIQD